MTKICRLPFLASIAALMVVSGCGERNPRTIDDFNFGWVFKYDDSIRYSEADYDDSGWRELHLPHDWSIEGSFDENNKSTFSGGALPGGTFWYRKHFQVKGMEGHRYFIEFDGVFMNSSVYVNGILLGTRPYGYSSFSYDITEQLNDGDNLIAVRCDNEQQPNSRWYAGCGIYRDVRLVRTGTSHVRYNGVCVRTENDSVFVTASVAGNPEKVRFSITSPEGSKCGSVEGRRTEEGMWEAGMLVSNPEIWDIDKPSLYELLISVEGKIGETSDCYRQTFGFRTVKWDAENGFFLNGRNVKLQGVCLHHDLGCLGSAFYPRAMEKRLAMLKEMGCNAIRTSHNPPAPALLDMCDRMGFLVIDEALDMWRTPKIKYDYARYFDEWHETDIRDMVCRDRNHPCVILWSAGNEIPEQFQRSKENEVISLTGSIVDIFKKTDPTRLVTVGIDWPDTNNLLIKSGALDVLGINYRRENYDGMSESFPFTPLFGSEIASALESRGWYPQPSTRERKMKQIEDETVHQCPSYDNTCAVWSDLHARSWNAIKERKNMAGGFVWTGYDYLGEPTPYGWPSRSSYFGIIDLAGFPKDIYYMYQSEWTDKDVLHLFPHWNWKQGDSIDVWCYYSNADEVELFVNGKSMGRSSKQGDRLHAEWLKVPFEEGEIRAVSYKGKEKHMECSRETTGSPKTLHLSADRSVIDADGYDLCYVTVTALDSLGREIPTADDMLHFCVSGAGEFFGTDNGNPTDTLSLKGTDKALFAGKAMAVIRSVKDRNGEATLTVSSQYDTERITIKTR